MLGWVLDWLLLGVVGGLAVASWVVPEWISARLGRHRQEKADLEFRRSSPEPHREFACPSCELVSCRDCPDAIRHSRNCSFVDPEPS